MQKNQQWCHIPFLSSPHHLPLASTKATGFWRCVMLYQASDGPDKILKRCAEGKICYLCKKTTLIAMPSSLGFQKSHSASSVSMLHHRWHPIGKEVEEKRMLVGHCKKLQQCCHIPFFASQIFWASGKWKKKRKRGQKWQLTSEVLQCTLASSSCWCCLVSGKKGLMLP